MMSMRTPLGRVRGLGSAKDGTEHWWVQRVTSIALVPLAVWFIVSLVALIDAGHATMVAWIKNPVSATLLLLFIGTSIYHMKLGVQVVIEDYVHHEGLKTASFLVVTFAAWLVGLVTIVSVLKIAVGG